MTATPTRQTMWRRWKERETGSEGRRHIVRPQEDSTWWVKRHSVRNGRNTVWPKVTWRDELDVQGQYADARSESIVTRSLPVWPSGSKSLTAHTFLLFPSIVLLGICFPSLSRSYYLISSRPWRDTASGFVAKFSSARLRKYDVIRACVHPPPSVKYASWQRPKFLSAFLS